MRREEYDMVVAMRDQLATISAENAELRKVNQELSPPPIRAVSSFFGFLLIGLTTAILSLLERLGYHVVAQREIIAIVAIVGNLGAWVVVYLYREWKLSREVEEVLISAEPAFEPHVIEVERDPQPEPPTVPQPRQPQRIEVPPTVAFFDTDDAPFMVQRRDLNAFIDRYERAQGELPTFNRKDWTMGKSRYSKLLKYGTELGLFVLGEAGRRQWTMEGIEYACEIVERPLRVYFDTPPPQNTLVPLSSPEVGTRPGRTEDGDRGGTGRSGGSSTLRPATPFDENAPVLNGEIIP